MTELEVQTALRSRVRALLESSEIGYFIGWENTRREGVTRAAFITAPEEAEKLVWDRRCVSSTAKYLLADRSPKQRIGVAVRGCDSRAVNRLLADKQVKREDVYLIGLPCAGKDNPACARCTHKNPLVYDELIGDTVPENPDADRFGRIAEMEALPPAERRRFWEAAFSKCIRCYACRNVCPCCNCRECYADQYRTGWQGKQMNTAENRVYGLTRAYHVGDRCIECGECERVCPVDLPIMLQTGKILRDINALFGPTENGLSADETPALGKYELGDMDDFM